MRIAGHRKSKKSSNKFSRRKIQRKRSAYAVRIAGGNRENRAFGHVGIAIIQNIFITAAAPTGILFPPAAFVRRARTNGFGHRACAAPNGRGTTIGTKTIDNKSVAIYSRRLSAICGMSFVNKLVIFHVKGRRKAVLNLSESCRSLKNG